MNLSTLPKYSVPDPSVPMIWHLMKRDRKMVRGMAGVMAAGIAGAVPGFIVFKLKHPPVKLPGVPAIPDGLSFMFGVIVIGFVWFMVTLVSFIQKQRAPYEAALPIAAADLWLSRILLLLAMTWSPVLIAVLVMIALGVPPWPFIQAPAIFTVLLLAAKCFRMRGIGAPPWLGVAGFLVLLLAIKVGTPFFPKHAKPADWLVAPPSGIVLTICALASVSLFAWGWANVPKSFQLVPPESPQESRSETKEPSKFALAPLFRAIYGRSTIILLALLFWFGIIMAGNTVYLGLLLGSMGPTLAEIRIHCRWLLTLPISPRRLFGAIVLPQTAAVAAGVLASILTRRSLSSNARLMLIAAELVGLYSLIFLSGLPAWRRLSKIRTIRWGVQILWAPLVIWYFAVIGLSSNSFMQRLADRPPAPGWQLAVVLAVPATYWLAEKAFREQEYRASLIELNANNRNTI